MSARNSQPKEAEGELTQAEAACSPMERRFAHWLMNLPPKRGFRVQAAKLAGYGKKSDSHVLNSIAQDLLSKQRVIDLITEITRKQIRSAAPEAIAAVKDIIANPDHRDRLKAANVVLERVDPTVMRHDVNVRHEIIDRDGEAVAYLRRLKALGVERPKLEQELGFSDLPRYERLLALEDARNALAGPVIEEEATEVLP
jgi:phage terminase small subunit